MVRISDRLRTVAHMCEKGAVVADIGTDHGYLPIYLVQEGIARSAIAMDLRKGPLDKAKKHICDNCLEDRIQTRLSDGLEKLSANEADIITICGMGGRLIADIVTKGMNVITRNTTLIVSPHIFLFHRDWLLMMRRCLRKTVSIILLSNAHRQTKMFIVNTVRRNISTDGSF